MKPFRDTKMKTFRQFLEEVEPGKEMVVSNLNNFTHWSHHPDADYVLGGIASFLEGNPEITGKELHKKMDESPFHENASLFHSMDEVAGGNWTVKHTEEALNLIRRRGI